MHGPPSQGRPLVRVRPSGATFWRGVGARAAVMLPLIIVGLAPRGDAELAPWARWAIIGAGVLVALIAVALTTTTVELTPATIRARRLIGTQRVVPRERIAFGVLVQQYRQFANMTAPKLLVVDADRRRLLHLTGQLFADTDLTRLAEGIGLQLFDVIPGPTNARGLDQRHPGLLPLTERRPVLIGLVLAVVIIAVVVVLVVAAEG